MKKIAGILALLLALGLVGCKSSESTKGNANGSNTKVEDKKSTKDNVDSIIGQLVTLIDEKKYDDAKSLMQKLNSNDLSESQKVTVNKLKERIDSESAKTEESKNAIQPQGQKQQYENKLANIENSLKYLDEKEASGTTADMRTSVNERYKKWDAALNEIYGVLKGQLSANDMKNLQSEEIQWISNRDAKAEKSASEMKGGSMESVLYTGSLAATTRSRCYELVEKYMH
ncbi:protein of unknown function DUF1311 [Clostridium carboxidivorans P7]|uniref:Lysozyme inhibitor LprI-like N-terminal domain-containing protein n=1 Tax=Clostridium carboxidivorans P7 TaxID=536227 RepID=C6PSS8_9CLOT|nr:lysozyme inhibitor LprI family protein [Clostridium carboxidivorans]EET87667.1 protein of unknown function DUF1311 [Clostridium carboxidivorans P7]